MKKIALIIFIALCWNASLVAEIPQYNTALKQYQSGKYEESLNTIRSVFDEHRASLDLRLLAAANYLAQGNIKSAQDHLHRGIKDHPKRIEPRAMLAALLRKTGKAGKALAVGRRAIKETGDHIAIRLELASAYIQMGSYKNAQNHLAQARRLEPKNFHATYLDGLAYLRQGSLDNAEFRLRAALTLKPSSDTVLANLYNNLGYTLEKKGNLSKGSGDSAQARVRYTESKKYYKLALEKKGDHKQAVPGLERVNTALDQ